MECPTARPSERRTAYAARPQGHRWQKETTPLPRPLRPQCGDESRRLAQVPPLLRPPAAQIEGAGGWGIGGGLEGFAVH